MKTFLLLAGFFLTSLANAEPRYTFQQRTEPRPLRIHVLKVDLPAGDCTLDLVIAPDPDGAGPAEAELEKPADLVNQPDIVAAINANSFGEVPAPPPGTHPDWRVHLPVDIGGWAKNTREQRSLPQPGFWNFWIDPDNRPHIGDLKEPVPDARLAIAGFNPLVVDGKNVNPEDGQRHPRTAIGFDEAGKTLVMVVVDGRQRGFSEGMSSHELAGLMQELGCHNAINLDGGGTSIMFATDAGHLKIVNSPSQAGTRPTPVMLVVRKLAAAATGH